MQRIICLDNETEFVFGAVVIEKGMQIGEADWSDDFEEEE